MTTIPMTPPAAREEPVAAASRLMLPVDGGAAGLDAVRSVVRQLAGRAGPAAVWLVHVHPPLRRHAARFVSGESLRRWRRERADAAFADARALLHRAGVDCRVVERVGDVTEQIVQAARETHCGRIVVGTSRMSPLARFVEGSIVARLLAASPVPVEVVATSDAPMWRQLRAPAAVGAAFAALATLAAD